MYAVPEAWVRGTGHRIVTVDPSKFFLDILSTIECTNGSFPAIGEGGEWSRHAVIYNIFVRSTCAFDHNQNGTIDIPANDDGFREVGTFLKAIALLPYVKRLGANTIHLLPITAIGRDGNKGTLGSPYAIKNPYKLDHMLSEPLVGLGPEEEFAAFVEAAHRLGMRVVVEFVFRTAAKDSDWILERPEWFYWIREDIPDRAPSSTDESKYGPPLFSGEELRHIIAATDQRQFDRLIPPHDVYRAMFTPPPKPERIKHEQGRLIGYLGDGTRVRIPGAFADWPPNDTQPPWGDVTYLKLYDHPDFNYMSYNTVRMYDARLARPECANTLLWEKIVGIIPHFQKTFGIDGVMIDMGHALPIELKQRMVGSARSLNPDFAFWDENFSVTSKSREEGYNAVIGYCWSDHHHVDKFKKLLGRFEYDSFPIPFFATPESHNTPRAATRKGGVLYSKAAWFADNFIPAIPFIHSGFELGESYPVNTGLDFTPEELRNLPSERLPLFSEYAYDWARKNQCVDWIEKVSALRRQFAQLVADPHPATFRMVPTGNPSVIAFLRTSKDGSRNLVAVANYDFASDQSGTIAAGVEFLVLGDLVSGRRFEVRDWKVLIHLSPGECLLLTPLIQGENDRP